MKILLKGWWRFCVLLAVLSSICTVIIIKAFETGPENAQCEKGLEEDIEEDIRDLILVKRSEAGTDDLCIVVKDGNKDILNRLYNNQYLLVKKIKGYWLEYHIDSNWSSKAYYDEPVYEKYDLELYDIDTLQLVNHIDAKKLMAEILNQNEMYYIAYAGYGKSRTFMFRLEALYNYKASKILKYDLMTGERVLETVSTEMGGGYQRKLSLLTEENVKERSYNYSLPAQNGFSQFECVEEPDMPGTVLVKMASADLPSYNEALYSAFPDLQEFKGKNGYCIGIYLHGYMAPESILGLFKNDGEIIQYQGLMVSGAAAYDGKEHAVKNADEYYHWIGDDF